jgi:diphosphomevalonate decarboxylase
MRERLSRLVRAPSNIALIKYMGKTDSSLNLPENSSLSMTLDALSTWVRIERVPSGLKNKGGTVILVPEAPEGAPTGIRVPDLGAAGRAKVLRHVERVLEAAAGILPAFGLQVLAPHDHDFTLRSGNTFPEASGIASSASSFAAITLAVALASAAEPEAFEQAWESDLRLRREFARLSRQGSGSSCRSFEGPFVEWAGEDARAVETAMPNLAHFVVLVSEEAKRVSSSEAHSRIKTSPLWAKRVERVEKRLELLRSALQSGDIAAASRLSWSEFWEMHSLFHTCEEPFTYWKPGTIEALDFFAPFVKSSIQSDLSVPISIVPPIVTMDAGPNLHLIVPATDAAAWRLRLDARFGAARILEDKPGRGARVVSEKQDGRAEHKIRELQS